MGYGCWVQQYRKEGRSEERYTAYPTTHICVPVGDGWCLTQIRPGTDGIPELSDNSSVRSFI